MSVVGFLHYFRLLTVFPPDHRKAARSGIPDAGLGVFIKVKPPIGTEVSEGGRFVLKKGEMIDLGVYGMFEWDVLRRIFLFVGRLGCLWLTFLFF